MVGLRRRQHAGEVLYAPTGGSGELLPTLAELHTTWRCRGGPCPLGRIAHPDGPGKDPEHHP